MKNLLILVICSGILCYCTSPKDSVKTPGEKIITAPGPEDMVLDTSLGQPRIIISTDSRRSKPRPGGQIQFIWIGDTVVHTFIIANSQLEKIYPHGVALARQQDTTKLFVISHEPLVEDPNDYNHHRIHRFRVGRDSLFYEYTYEHELLRAPNDLFVTANGEIFVTNYLKRITTWQSLSTALFKRSTGSTVRYRPEQGWDEILTDQVYPNGIHLWQDKLFVAEGGRHRILVYQHQNYTAPIHQIKDPGLLFADNFSASADGQLYITSHPCMFCFSAHARHGHKPSPSLGWHIDPSNYSLNNIFSDDGSNISAASTLIRWQDQYYLCQVFNPYLLKVPAIKN